MRLIFYILTLFTLTSCSLLLGIREPTVLTQAEVQKAAKKLDLDDHFLYSLDSVSLEELNKLPYKPGWPTGFRPLQYKVFDKEGKLIAQYSTCEGRHSRFPGLLSVPPQNNINPHDADWTLQKELEFIRPVGTSFNLPEQEFTFVVYWADWLGKPGKKLVQRVKEYQDKNPDAEVGIILVNVLEWPGD